jgi:hypothetical protein
MTAGLEQRPHLGALCAAYSDAGSIATVAVVGNAPLRPDATRAARIDAADLVVRVNGFALDRPGDAATVGTRTNVVLFNRALRATPWFFDDYRRRLYLMVEPGRLHWEVERWPGWWPPDLGHVVLSNREVILPLSAALGLPTRQEPVWATTGVVALWLARTLFPAAHVVAAGFSMIDDPDQRWWPHSYGEGSPVGSEHVLHAESELVASWVADGTLTHLA